MAEENKCMKGAAHHISLSTEELKNGQLYNFRKYWKGVQHLKLEQYLLKKYIRL